MTHAWIMESHKVTKKLVIYTILFKYVVTIVLVMTKKMIVIPTLEVISNWVRLRWVYYVVQRTKFDVTFDLSQKIEMKDDQSDQ